MYKAIGVIELKCIPKGVEAADAALKSAGVEMVSSHPSCPGKYEIILSGSISNVTAAVNHVVSRFEGYVIDSSIMGWRKNKPMRQRIDPILICPQGKIKYIYIFLKGAS